MINNLNRMINKEVFSSSRPKCASAYEPSKYNLGSEDLQLLEQWESTWGEKNYPEFTSYYVSAFVFSCVNAEKNRDYNFWSKRRVVSLFRILVGAQLVYLAALAFMFSSPLWLYCLNHIFKIKYSKMVLLNAIPHDAGLIAGIEAVLLTSFIIIFIARNKWLQVKGYQQTWARHRLAQYRLSNEMIRYISNIEPYNNAGKADNDKRFITIVLKILDDDIQQFHQNLSEKEVPLLDEFLAFQRKKDE